MHEYIISCKGLLTLHFLLLMVSVACATLDTLAP